LPTKPLEAAKRRFVPFADIFRIARVQAYEYFLK